MNMGIVRLISLDWLACVLVLIILQNHTLLSSVRGLCSDEESSALLQFKNTLAINYTASLACPLTPCTQDPTQACHPHENWEQSWTLADCCSWDGVTCDEVTGHVIELDLHCSGLEGIIYSNNSLFNLPHLQSLNLSFNNFTGTIITSWLFPTSLVNLSLANSQVSGEIPPQMGNLLNLSNLMLDSNFIGGMIPPVLFSLPLLETLDLGNNSLFGSIPSNVSGFQNLRFLNLSNNKLSGTIPSALLALPSLATLDLGKNELTGHVSEFQSNLLQHIDLGNNNLQGVNFSSISKMVNLTMLDLASNNLSGTLELDVFSNLKELPEIHLSHNNHLSLNSSNRADSPLPKLKRFYMSNCNVKAFPFFLKNFVQLMELDLSKNDIHGSIPEWLGDMGKNSLFYLNLSHNFLTHVQILPWNSLTILDLNFNSIDGALPIPPTVTIYFISNNKIQGKILSRICDLNRIQYVDFSNNGLSGNIPNCLFNLKDMLVLNLRSNNLSGTIPKTSGSNLTTLDLSHNQLEGRIPRSLVNYPRLEVLDVAHNHISDTFPIWLENMPKLKILVLRSNMFYGSIGKPRNPSSLTNLSIIDLSNNNFSGNLPSHYFRTWTSMMMTDDNVWRPNIYKSDHYFDSVTLVNKGQEMKLERTLIIFKAVDFSNNNFHGKIPEAICNLTSIMVLNLSSNGLVGDIPPSIGNLVNLQSLDLSNNKLSGRIPPQLNKLTFLGAFNVSQNNLHGPIPQSGQLSTFPCDSYKGNPSLCGIPLPKKCEEKPTVPYPPIPSFKQNGDSGITLARFTWKSVIIGYVCGAIFGTISGNIIIRRNKEWLLSIFNIRLLRRMKPTQ